MEGHLELLQTQQVVEIELRILRMTCSMDEEGVVEGHLELLDNHIHDCQLVVGCSLVPIVTTIAKFITNTNLLNYCKLQ